MSKADHWPRQGGADDRGASGVGGVDGCNCLPFIRLVPDGSQAEVT